MSASGHPHAAPEAAAVRHERRTWMGAVLTAAAAAIELAGGGWTGSAALAGEGLHMGAHLSAFLLAGLGYVLARRLRTDRRADAAELAADAAALANGLLLLVLGAALAWGSLQSLQRATPVAFGSALGIAVFGFAVNLVAIAVLNHAHAHETGHARDLNFRAIYLHVLGDAAVALLAILGLVLGRSFGWRWTDAAAGGLGALLLMLLGFQVAFRSARRLVEDRRALARPVRPGVAPALPLGSRSGRDART